MKKYFCFILVFTIILSLGSINVSAETNSNKAIELQESIQYFEDGSYIVIEKIASDVQTRAVGTKTYSNIATYYNSDDVAQCALKVTGTFEVNYGVSVRCTNVTATTYVYVNGWTVENVTKSSSSGSGASAYASASGEFVKKVLFITTSRIPVSVSVTCDKNGD